MAPRYRRARQPRAARQSHKDRQGLIARCECVNPGVGASLCELGMRIDEAYFSRWQARMLGRRQGGVTRAAGARASGS